MLHHTVDRPGARIAVHTAGDGGPPVFLVQGTGVAGEGWRPQIDALAGDHRVAWFDGRGLGESTWNGARFDAQTLVDDALAALASLDWPPATVVGHSLGGVLALQLALDAPERVAGLGLWSTFLTGAAVVGMNPAKLWTSIRMNLGFAASRRRAALELVFPEAHLAGQDPDALFDRMSAMFGRPLHTATPIVWAQLRAIRALDPRPRLAELTVPARVFTGAEDIVAPVAGNRALAEALGAPLTVIDGTGHALPVQRPDLAEAELRALVAASTGTRPSPRPTPGHPEP